jgi:hypothetical protein
MKSSRYGAVWFAVAALGIGVMGYVVGYRKGMQAGVRMEVVARGVLATQMTRMLDNNRVDYVRLQLDADIDNGIVQWGVLQQSPVFQFVDYVDRSGLKYPLDDYITRLATHRRDNASIYSDPEFMERTTQSIGKRNPAFAAEISASQVELQNEIRVVVEKYAQPAAEPGSATPRGNGGDESAFSSSR